MLFTSNIDWGQLLTVRLTQSGGIEFTLGFLVLLCFGVVVVVVASRLFRGRWPLRLEVVEAEVALGNIGRIKLRPTYEEIQIAHKAWTELATRKAAVPFDEENDVIVEVYDSWYELFGRMRELVKELPAQQLRRSQDTRALAMLLVDALNRGLRPHLTTWQARFRQWYEQEIKSSLGVAPQAVQRKYPDYRPLVSDLKKVNSELVQYAAVLKKLSQGID